MDGMIWVVGAVAIDMVAVREKFLDGTSNPSDIRLGLGGVGYRIFSNLETPRRFIQALFDATEGYDGDPKLLKVFQTECRGGPDYLLSQVIEGPIHFYALCEHHALPFHGHAYIGYIPHEHIIGLSKLTRLARLFTKRFAVQERIGQQIADAMVEMLQPHAVAVYLAAQHMCVAMRGVRAGSPFTRTTTWRGEYEKNPDLRAEFLSACGARR